MKPQSILRLALCSLFAFTSLLVFSQNQLAITASTKVAGADNAVANLNNLDRSNMLSAKFITEAFPKMARHITREFPVAPEKKYYSINGGLLVQFSENQNAWNVVYDENQRFSYSVTDLAPENIDANIKQLVSRYYKGQNIQHARMITDATGTTSHQLVLKQNDTFTEVLVKDNELYTLSELSSRM